MNEKLAVRPKMNTPEAVSTLAKEAASFSPDNLAAFAEELSALSPRSAKMLAMELGVALAVGMPGPKGGVPREQHAT